MRLPSLFALAGYAFFGVAAPNIAPALSHSVAHARPPATCDSDHFRNVDGRCVQRPTKAPSAPAGATARCRDGTYSFSQHRQGTCSHHGGVAEWL